MATTNIFHEMLSRTWSSQSHFKGASGSFKIDDFFAEYKVAIMWATNYWRSQRKESKEWHVWIIYHADWTLWKYGSDHKTKLGQWPWELEKPRDPRQIRPPTESAPQVSGVDCDFYEATFVRVHIRGDLILDGSTSLARPNPSLAPEPQQDQDQPCDTLHPGLRQQPPSIYYQAPFPTVRQTRDTLSTIQLSPTPTESTQEDVPQVAAIHQSHSPPIPGYTLVKQGRPRRRAARAPSRSPSPPRKTVDVDRLGNSGKYGRLTNMKAYIVTYGNSRY
ncbi:hypothetical protein WAI453_011609 [Rhynchosporium graminicola]